MKVTLLHNTPLWVCSSAVRKCWASEDKSDTDYSSHEVVCGEKDKELIHRIGNKNKHSSTLEHLNYSFDIDGISRACLQELARHRHASVSVKSTRYTLKELGSEPEFTIEEGKDRACNYVVLSGCNITDFAIIRALEDLRAVVASGVSNDKAKYCLPEAYKTSLVWTINARSLQNFLALRTSPSALWEIRDLANEIFTQLPDDHRYLFEEFVCDDTYNYIQGEP